MAYSRAEPRHMHMLKYERSGASAPVSEIYGKMG